MNKKKQHGAVQKQPGITLPLIAYKSYRKDVADLQSELEMRGSNPASRLLT